MIMHKLIQSSKCSTTISNKAARILGVELRLELTALPLTA
jgi:hypothetical protein